MPEQLIDSPNASSAYDDFVAASPQGTVFATSWWLDAVVGPGRWRSNVIHGDAGRIVAAWPGVVKHVGGREALVGAPLTPWLGPLLSPGDGKESRSREIEQTERLLEESMSTYAHIEARCSPAYDYWTPLRWNDFTQTTHYTWRLPDCRDLAALEERFYKRTKGPLRKALKSSLTVEAGNVDELIEAQRKTFDRQGIGEHATSPALMRKIEAAASAHDACSIFVAREDEGRVHAASMFVYDANMVWYLVGGGDPELRSSGGATLLMWEGIKLAGERGAGFDFEGSMLRPVERFVRGFGGEPTPYSIVRRTSSRRVRISQSVKRTGRRVLRRSR
jgi:hypothetical protein